MTGDRALSDPKLLRVVVLGKIVDTAKQLASNYATAARCRRQLWTQLEQSSVTTEDFLDGDPKFIRRCEDLRHFHSLDQECECYKAQVEELAAMCLQMKTRRRFRFVQLTVKRPWHELPDEQLSQADEELNTIQSDARAEIAEITGEEATAFRDEGDPTDLLCDALGRVVTATRGLSELSSLRDVGELASLSICDWAIVLLDRFWQAFGVAKEAIPGLSVKVTDELSTLAGCPWAMSTMKALNAIAQPILRTEPGEGFNSNDPPNAALRRERMEAFQSADSSMWPKLVEAIEARWHELLYVCKPTPQIADGDKPLEVPVVEALGRDREVGILAAWLKTSTIKGERRRIVEALIKGGGRLELVDLIDDAGLSWSGNKTEKIRLYNNQAYAINKELKKSGVPVRLRQCDSCPIVRMENAGNEGKVKRNKSATRGKTKR